MLGLKRHHEKHSSPREREAPLTSPNELDHVPCPPMKSPLMSPGPRSLLLVFESKCAREHRLSGL